MAGCSPTNKGAVLPTGGTGPSGRPCWQRRTSATVLLILGVPERAVMGLMGWSTTAMAARYQHMVDAVRADVPRQVDGLIWKTEAEGRTL